MPVAGVLGELNSARQSACGTHCWFALQFLVRGSATHGLGHSFRAGITGRYCNSVPVLRCVGVSRRPPHTHSHYLILRTIHARPWSCTTELKHLPHTESAICNLQFAICPSFFRKNQAAHNILSEEATHTSKHLPITERARMRPGLVVDNKQTAGREFTFSKMKTHPHCYPTPSRQNQRPRRPAPVLLPNTPRRGKL